MVKNCSGQICGDTVRWVRIANGYPKTGGTCGCVPHHGSTGRIECRDAATRGRSFCQLDDVLWRVQESDTAIGEVSDHLGVMMEPQRNSPSDSRHSAAPRWPTYTPFKFASICRSNQTRLPPIDG